jgi:hypothetical protein
MYWTGDVMMITQHVENGGERKEYCPTPEDPRKGFDGFENTANFLKAAPLQIAEFVLDEDTMRTKANQNE